ncbi:MAG: hypothetical protein CVT92_01870 [Bacteroidetes bacterium HGW-Bacteroidetes-1]|jgi:aminopeptidase N|nr:MAG: hypothetical protein CVT92_01870 [Bacteroidetes bacterium HGW-Bacteroidetes-1]
MIVTLAHKYNTSPAKVFKFKINLSMKKIIVLFLLLPFFAVFGQQNDTHIHDRFCRYYPEQTDTPKFAWRNDWQSPLVHNYDVTFYFLDIEVSNTTINVGGTVQIHAKVVSPVMETFAFELLSVINIQSIVVNGITYSGYTRDGDNVLVPITALNQGDTFIASITYYGTPPTGGFFSGVTNAYSNQWQKSVTWTLSEPFAAKSWLPCKQVLTDKADSVWVFLTTPEGTMAGSQGLLTNVSTMPNNKLRYEWKSNYPIAYYLISFAVSDYQEYNIYAKPLELAGDSVLVQNFVYNHPNYLNTNQTSIDAVVPMIELFSDLYLLYPFWEEKYGHCITQLGGGMEHQTMTTMGGFSFNLIAHELGHMWFGDNVTCATWSDIWINEGFATYSNYLAQEMLNGWSSGQTFMIGTQNNVISQPGGSVYVPEDEATPENVWRIFNGRLSYDKGAAIIHTLRHEINNDATFFALMNAFQVQFSDSTATGEDFRMVAEAIAGMDFEQFFEQWYYGEGYPKYDIEWYMGNNDVILNVAQTPSSSTPLFKMTMDYKLNFSDNTNTIVRLYQDANLNQFVIPVDKQVVSIQVDPNNWTLEKVNSNVVSMSEKDNPNYFSFGPNPVKESLNIFMLNDQNERRMIQITDVSGKMIQQEIFIGSDHQLDVSKLSKGIYILTISDNNQQFSRKLIK